MPDKKYYRRLIPVSQYDAPGMETWLSAMAEKGFYLKNFLIFAVFTKGIPKLVRYRQEPARFDEEWPDPMQKDLYYESGWLYIATYHKFFHIYFSDDSHTEEIHTDPVVQSEIFKRTVRQLRIISGISIGGMAILSLMLFYLYHDNFAEKILLELDGNFYYTIPLFLLNSILLFFTTRRFLRLRRRLQSGLPYEYNQNYKPRLARRIIEMILGCIPFITLAAVLLVYCTTGSKNELPLSEADSGIPALSLADIDPVQSEHCSDGSFYREYTPLVPIQYVVTYYVQTDNKNYIPAVLQTNYYETVFASLSKPIFDEITEIYSIYYERVDKTQPINTVLFDEAAYVQTDYAQYLIAYRDKTVIAVRYVGDKYLPDYLELIADTFL